MHAPLTGIRVLDLSNVLAGPFCCQQLAHLGADVIKVESPHGGDLARQLGADPQLNDNLMGISFLAQNSGKRSITLNLKSPDGVAVFKKLLDCADVLVENFRPGVMDRLGLGYDVLHELNPTLVYCAISGFGQDGPLSKLPAYDQVIQGMSGVMDITGDDESAPLRVGFPIADTLGGMTAAFAITSALANKRKNRGCFIDISMLESLIAAMGWTVSNYLVGGVEPQAQGNDNVTASPSGTFRTGDGLINIAANKQQQFETICELLNLPELVADPRFSKRHARLEHRAALTALLERELQSKPASHWLTAFNAAGVPAGPVLTVAEALAQQQIAERGLVGTFTRVAGVGRDISSARSAVRYNGEVAATSRAPAELGADSEEILLEAGFSQEEIANLRALGAI